ncbi:MAG: carbohydrate porin, partial [Cetobacterium somerae]
TQNDISFEMMYANSPDHDSMKYFGVNETEVYKRDAAADGLYTGLYYKPRNFFGLKGWGQHYLQYSNGVLAGSGLGRLNTVGNMLAHKSSQAYQLGLGGGYNIAEKVTLLSAFRATYTEKMDAREYQINPSTKDEWKTGFADTQREIGLTLRPIYTLNNFVDLWLEAGIGNINYKTYNDIENDILIYKVSVGPQLRYSIGYAETTIRAYVTYINEHRKVDYSNSREKNKRNDLIAGFQMSAWW